MTQRKKNSKKRKIVRKGLNKEDNKKEKIERKR